MEQQYFTIGGTTITFTQATVGAAYLVSSLEVANVLNKRHADMLRTIRNLYSYDNIDYSEEHMYDDGVESSTASTSYRDECNREQPMIMMNRDMVILVISKSTGEIAEQYLMDFIQVFNFLEDLILRNLNSFNAVDQDEFNSLNLYAANQQSIAQTTEYELQLNAQNILDLEQEILMREREAEDKQRKIDGMMPVYEYGVNVMAGESELTMSEWAKQFTIGSNQCSNQKLIQTLKTHSYMQQGDNIAYQHHVNIGYFRNITESKNGHVFNSMVVTPQGIMQLTGVIQGLLNSDRY